MLTYAALNDLDVTMGDIKGAYLSAPTSEKHWILLEQEFGEDAGKYALIVCALYGGKHAGRDYWLYLQKCMTDLGFKSCYADPEVWMRESTNKHGKEVYKYVLLYTDDCLVISKDGMHIIQNEIGKIFNFEEDSICHPNGHNYLGGKIIERKLDGNQCCWLFNPFQYVSESARSVEKQYQSQIENGDERFARKDSMSNTFLSTLIPLLADYHPELDMSDELSATDTAYYQSLIGIL